MRSSTFEIREDAAAAAVDPDLAQSARRRGVFVAGVLSALGATLALFMYVYGHGFSNLFGLACGALVVLVASGCALWVQFGGEVRKAAIVLVATLCLATWCALSVSGGIESRYASFLILIPIVAGTLLGARGIKWAGVANGLFIVALAAAGLAGWVPPEASLRPDVQIVTIGCVLLLCSIGSWAGANALITYYSAFTARLRHLTDQVAVTAREAEQARARFEAFAGIASDWLWEVDGRGICTFSSGRFAEGLAQGARDVVGRRYLSVLTFNVDDRRTVAGAIRRAEPFCGVVAKYRSEAGEDYVVELAGRPIFDARGDYQGFRGVAQNITDAMDARAQLQFFARHDELTGLLNRRSVNAHLEALQNRSAPAVLFLLDLDGFKAVNDGHGHAVGDELLKRVAARLSRSAGGDDVVARLGGDEFVIVSVEAADDPGAQDRLARSIIARLSEPYEIDGATLSISSSVGVAALAGESDTVEALFKRADAALYEAKRAGRARHLRFDPDMGRKLNEQAALRASLETALSADDVVLHYQPQYALSDGRLIGFEALARWTHPELGPVPPGRFIDVAEQSGLIVELDRSLLRAACREATRWPSQSGRPALRLAVNISPSGFSAGDFVSDVRDVLAETGLAPARLELEITERAIVANPNAASRVLQDLNMLGVGVAIDDFGTGCSMLNDLKDLPLTRIKIDRSFVQDLEGDERRREIAEAVVRLGQSLGLTVIAEGVERPSQLDTLKALDVDEAQGHLFARPEPPESIPGLLLNALVNRRIADHPADARAG